MSRILIVDGDPNLREAAARALTARRYEVVGVGDPKEALERLQAGMPDLLVTELLFAGMDGMKFIGKIRALPAGAGLPILLLSSLYRSTAAQRDVVSDARARGFLLKPFAMSRLLGEVERILPPPAPSAPTSPAPSPPSPATRRAIPPEGIAGLVRRLSAEGLTGILEIEGTEGEGARRIFLADGFPAHAEVGGELDSIEPVLVGRGLLSAEAYRDLLREAETRGIPPERILISKGVFPPEAIHAALRERVVRQVAACLHLKTGTWSFKEDASFIERTPLYRISPAEAILRWARERRSLEEAGGAIEPFLDRRVLPAPLLARALSSLGLTLREEAFVRSARPGALLREVLGESPLGLAATLALVRGLLATGLLTAVVEGKPEDPPCPVLPAGEAAAFEARIWRDYLQLKSEPPEAALGLDPGSPRSEVLAACAAFHELYRPDRWPEGISDRAREQARDLFLRVEAVRARLEQPREAPPAPLSPAPDEGKVRLEVVRREAEQHLAAGNFGAAEARFAEMTRLDPRSGSAWMGLGWALYSARNGRRDPVVRAEALHALKKGMGISPDQARGYYWLALVYRDEGKAADAIRWLARALEVEPSFREADEEMKHLTEGLGD